MERTTPKRPARAGRPGDKTAAKRAATKPAKPPKAASKQRPGKSAKPKLLSGGNPQIAKADGDAPVQDYIAAMPGWKRDVGRRLDALVVRTVPGVRKAVRWNTPFYGVEGQGWFLAFHCEYSERSRPAIPRDRGHLYRLIPATHSDGFRPPVPIDRAHPFRAIAATQTEG